MQSSKPKAFVSVQTKARLRAEDPWPTRVRLSPSHPFHRPTAGNAISQTFGAPVVAKRLASRPMPSMPTSGHRAAHAGVVRRRRSVRLYHGGCRNATPPTPLRQGPLSVVPGRMAQPGDEWGSRLWFCYAGAAAGVLCIVGPDYRQIQKNWQDRRKPWFPPSLEHGASSDVCGFSAAGPD